MKRVKVDPEDPNTTFKVLFRDTKGVVIPKHPYQATYNLVEHALSLFRDKLDLGLAEFDSALGAVWIPLILAEDKTTTTTTKEDDEKDKNNNRGLTIWWNANEQLTPGGRCVDTGSHQILFTTHRQLVFAIRCGLRLHGRMDC